MTRRELGLDEVLTCRVLSRWECTHCTGLSALLRTVGTQAAEETECQCSSDLHMAPPGSQWRSACSGLSQKRPYTGC